MDFDIFDPERLSDEEIELATQDFGVTYSLLSKLVKKCSNFKSDTLKKNNIKEKLENMAGYIGRCYREIDELNEKVEQNKKTMQTLEKNSNEDKKTIKNLKKDIISDCKIINKLNKSIQKYIKLCEQLHKLSPGRLDNCNLCEFETLKNTLVIIYSHTFGNRLEYVEEYNFKELGVATAKLRDFCKKLSEKYDKLSKSKSKSNSKLYNQIKNLKNTASKIPIRMFKITLYYLNEQISKRYDSQRGGIYYIQSRC